MIPSLEGWPTKAKEVPSPHEVRLTPLDTNPVPQCLGHQCISVISIDISALLVERLEGRAKSCIIEAILLF